MEGKLERDIWSSIILIVLSEFLEVLHAQAVHRGVFCQFPFQRIYYYGSNNSTGKEISKTHLCGLYSLLKYAKNFMIHEWEACSAYFD
mgnify:CR=1 FL=1